MKMKVARILSIGDEILFGQTLDSNSNFIAKKLGELGFKVDRIQALPDEFDTIVSCLNEAASQADLILTTGGLGPTKDDITKQALSHFFNAPLEMNQEALTQVEHYFTHVLGRKMNELNTQQALLPKGTIGLQNQVGTAPGLWTQKDDKVFISMPGVPSEMRHLMTVQILPKLKSHFSCGYILHRNILVTGIPESELAPRLEKIEEALPSHIKLAYLPTGKRIRLRLTGTARENKLRLQEDLQVQVEKISNEIPEFVYSIKDESIEVLVGKQLREKKLTLSTAESFTSGRLASLITEVSGSSTYFKGSIVAYLPEVKEALLDVNKKTIEAHTTVSAEVALEMAKGVRKKLGSSIGISTTGVAGPLTDEFNNEVGRAWIAIVSEEKECVKSFYYPKRERNHFAQSIAKIAVEELYRFLQVE